MAALLEEAGLVTSDSRAVAEALKSEVLGLERRIETLRKNSAALQSDLIAELETRLSVLQKTRVLE